MSSDRPLLSIVLICQDEEKMIRQWCRCAKRLADAASPGRAEVVVVDGGSRDRTLDILRAEGGARFTVVENPWPGYAAQRQLAHDLCSGEWILPMDADVVVADSTFDVLPGMLRAGPEVLSWSWGKITLARDRAHALPWALDPIIVLRRNVAGWGWEDRGGLEEIVYDGRVVCQHPCAFSHPWQRYEPRAVLVHFEPFQGPDKDRGKWERASKLPRSHWFGRPWEEFEAARREEAEKAVPLESLFPGLTFEAEVC